MRRVAGILGRHPVLHEFDMDLVDPPDPTGADDGPRLPHHRKT